MYTLHLNSEGRINKFKGGNFRQRSESSESDVRKHGVTKRIFYRHFDHSGLTLPDLHWNQDPESKNEILVFRRLIVVLKDNRTTRS